MGIAEQPYDLNSAEQQRRILAALQESTLKLAAHRKQQTEPIAVVGMGCRFPKSVNIDEFWSLLDSAGDAISDLPSDRWNGDEFKSDSSKEPGKIVFQGGGYIQDIDAFDARFFEITQREGRCLDPQQRLLLETAWITLEHAGISPTKLNGKRCGVFTGICSSDYLIQMNDQRDLGSIDPYFATGNAHGTAAGRLSYFLNWQGAALSIDTACSSSLVAVHSAIQSIRNMECDLAMALGVNLILAPNLSIGLSQAGMLSPSGRIRAFSDGADGFVRGEGCGAVLLKRLSHAQRDGDRIFCVLRGSAVNQDGRSNGLTAPNGLAQQEVIREALQRSGLSGADIDYIEAHGTGTELGDPIEMSALASVFAPRAERPLWIGSVKTNIGHLEGAAGIAGLIKACLALHHERIPAHLNFEKPSPHIDWQPGLQIPEQPVAWPRQSDHVRRAGVSSFGFGGTNAHVIVEEAPRLAESKQFETKQTATKQVASEATQTTWWLKVSAKTPEAFSALALRYAAALTDESSDNELSSASLDDIALAANIGRVDFACRGVVNFATRAELVSRLHQLADLKQPLSAGVLRSTLATNSSAVSHSVVSNSAVNDRWSREMQRYISGEEIDWFALYRTEGKPEGQSVPPRRTVSLPGYAFQRQRCWFKPTLDRSDSPNRSARSDRSLRLLGNRLDVASDSVIYETDLQHFPELAGHCLNGASVFPAAAFMELALTAGMGVCEQLALPSSLSVESLQLEQALYWSPDQSTRVQVVLQPVVSTALHGASKSTTPTSFRGEILSRQSTGWQRHARFQLNATSEPSIAPSSTSSTIAAPSAHGAPVDIDQHYATCDQVGLQYTNAFRSLVQLQATHTQAFGTVALPQADESAGPLPSPTATASRYLLHPALLDGCLQSIAALLPPSSGLWLPTAIASYQVTAGSRSAQDFPTLALAGPIHFVTTMSAYADAATSPDSLSLPTNRTLVDIELYDSQKQHFASIRQIELTQVPDSLLGTSDSLSEPEVRNASTAYECNAGCCSEEVQSHLQTRLASIIGCEANLVSLDEPLESMGLDSMMAYELLHDIKLKTGVKVSMQSLLGGVTLRQLVNNITQEQSLNVDESEASIDWIEGAL